MPNWVWAGYLAPLEGLDDILSKFLPTTVGSYKDKTYSFGYFDVALAMSAASRCWRRTASASPPWTSPWTKDEFDGRR